MDSARGWTLDLQAWGGVYARHPAWYSGGNVTLRASGGQGNDRV